MWNWEEWDERVHRYGIRGGGVYRFLLLASMTFFIALLFKIPILYLLAVVFLVLDLRYADKDDYIQLVQDVRHGGLVQKILLIIIVVPFAWIGWTKHSEILWFLSLFIFWIVIRGLLPRKD